MTSASPNMLASTAAKQQRPAFDQLATFLTVAETGSFSAAARLTGRTQPAISQAIARLEDIYGGDLFERRRGAPLALTPIGEAILPSAQILLKTIDEQMGTAAEAASGAAGAVVVGVDPDIATGRHRGGLVAFAIANPAARLRMIEASSAELLRQLEDRRIDLVITPAGLRQAVPALACERLWDERLFVALPAAHELASRNGLDWPTVASLRLMLATPDGETSRLAAIIADVVPCRPEYELHTVSRDTLLDMVGRGFGTSIVLGSAATPNCGVVFRPTVDATPSIAIEALWRKRDGNPLRHRLLRFIRKAVRESGGVGLSELLQATASAQGRG